MRRDHLLCKCRLYELFRRYFLKNKVMLTVCFILIVLVSLKVTLISFYAIVQEFVIVKLKRKQAFAVHD